MRFVLCTLLLATLLVWYIASSFLLLYCLPYADTCMNGPPRGHALPTPSPTKSRGDVMKKIIHPTLRSELVTSVAHSQSSAAPHVARPGILSQTARSGIIPPVCGEAGKQIVPLSVRWVIGHRRLDVCHLPREVGEIDVTAIPEKLVKVRPAVCWAVPIGTIHERLRRSGGSKEGLLE